MFTKILFSFCLSIFSLSAIAQDNSPHHIGASAGATTGFGLSYRYWPSKLGIQVTTLPTFMQNEGSVTSLGASVLYTLNDGDKIDLYSYLGNSILFLNSSTDSELEYNAGIGLGFKFDIFDELNINAQFGYGGLNITENYAVFSMVGEVGLYYHF